MLEGFFLDKIKIELMAEKSKLSEEYAFLCQKKLRKIVFKSKTFEEGQGCAPVPRFAAGDRGITRRGPFGVNRVGMQPSWEEQDWGPTIPAGGFQSFIITFRAHNDTDSEDNGHNSVWRKQFR